MTGDDGMRESGGNAPGWVWVLVFIMGWPLVGRLVGFVSIFVPASRLASAVIPAAALCGVAWVATLFACRRGAPRALWLTTLLGSVPAGVMVAALNGVVPPDPNLKLVPEAYTSAVWAFAASLAAVTFTVLAPVVIAWFASRRATSDLGVVNDDRAALAPHGLQ